MEKQQLARELRERQYQAGFIPREHIDFCSDDQMIDCYIKCSYCGKYWVNESQLKVAIRMARNSEEFIFRVNKFGKHEHFANQSSGEEGE